jgi:hypothetical protein
MTDTRGKTRIYNISTNDISRQLIPKDFVFPSQQPVIVHEAREASHQFIGSHLIGLGLGLLISGLLVWLGIISCGGGQ